MFQDSLFEVVGLSLFMPAEAKQFVFSALIGFLIGVERAWHGKAASLRTFSTICAGSCLFTILSVEAVGHGVGIASSVPQHDITRIAAQIVTGVGFLGGGVIFKSGGRIEGVTTGALVWLAAAIGMACGFNQIELVLWAVIIGVMMHFLSVVTHRAIAFRRLSRRRHGAVIVEAIDDEE